MFVYKERAVGLLVVCKTILGMVHGVRRWVCGLEVENSLHLSFGPVSLFTRVPIEV